LLDRRPEQPVSTSVSAFPLVVVDTSSTAASQHHSITAAASPQHHHSISAKASLPRFMAQHSCVACGLSRRAFFILGSPVIRHPAPSNRGLLRLAAAPWHPEQCSESTLQGQSWDPGRCPAAPAGAPGSPQVRWRVVGPHHGLCTAHQPQCTAHQAQCTAHQAQCTAHQPQCTAHRHRTPGTVHTATAPPVPQLKWLYSKIYGGCGVFGEVAG